LGAKREFFRSPAGPFRRGVFHVRVASEPASVTATAARKQSRNGSNAMQPSPLATRLPWMPYCQITRWPLILNAGWSSGKKDPARLRPDADGNGPHVASPWLNRR
jgi:hypothetical protein